MKADLDAGRFTLLIGDLNHGPDTNEHKLWTDAGQIDTFAKVGEGKGLTIKADMAKHRIDYVMAAGPIADRLTESHPLFEGTFRLNIADIDRSPETPVSEGREALEPLQQPWARRYDRID